MNIEDAMHAWTELLGSESVLDRAQAQGAYGADASGIRREIPAALRPREAAVIPEIVRVAGRFGVPLYPISTGRNWGYGTALPVRDGCVILDLSQLRRILHFDPEFGTVTLEPGVTQQMLADFLDAGSHPYLVPVTGAGPSCSIMGNALERGYGITPHADHFGAVTDLEAVLADGSVFKTALREIAGDELARLFKWGIGPYLTGLFTQSSFGVVTRMTVQLAPRPESVKVFLFGLRDDALLEPCVTRVRAILSSLPGTVGAINLMNRRRVLAMSAPYPADRLGADGLIQPEALEELGRQYQILPWTGFGTLYGTRRIVSAAQREIRAALKGVGSRLVFLSPEQARAIGRCSRFLPGAAGRRLAATAATLAKSLELVAGRPNETALPLCYWRNADARPESGMDPSRDGCGLRWYSPLVPMRPAMVQAYLGMVESTCRDHGIEPLVTLTSVSERLFDSTVPILYAPDGGAEGALRCFKALVLGGRAIGAFPYRVGVDVMRDLVGMGMGESGLSERLIRSMDPSLVVSPGRYG